MEKRPRNCYNRDLSDTSPIRAYDSQDNSFAAAFSVIRQAVADRAFPGASLAVTHADKLIVLKSFGSFVQKKDLTEAPSLSRPLRQGENFDVKPATVFDVASLTKPIATATMAMLLYERGLLELDAPVAGTVPEILEVPTADPRRARDYFPDASGPFVRPACVRKAVSEGHVKNRSSESSLYHATDGRSRHPRRIQRYRLHNPGRGA